jgi:hypothetical protein
MACLVCSPALWNISDDVGPTEVSIPSGGVVEATVTLETSWADDRALKREYGAWFTAAVGVQPVTGADSSGADVDDPSPHVIVELTDDQGATTDTGLTGGSESLTLSFQFCDGRDCDEYDGTICDFREATSCQIDYALTVANVGEVDVTVEWSAVARIQSEADDLTADVDLALTIQD